MSPAMVGPKSMCFMNAKKKTCNMDSHFLREVPVHKTQQFMCHKVKGREQFVPKHASDTALGDVIHAIMVPVAQKTRRVLHAESVCRAPSMESCFEEASSNSG